jgi:hypothetical protein
MVLFFRKKKLVNQMSIQLIFDPLPFPLNIFSIDVLYNLDEIMPGDCMQQYSTLATIQVIIVVSFSI